MRRSTIAAARAQVDDRRCACGSRQPPPRPSRLLPALALVHWWHRVGHLHLRRGGCRDARAAPGANIAAAASTTASAAAAATAAAGAQVCRADAPLLATSRVDQGEQLLRAEALGATKRHEIVRNLASVRGSQ